MWPNGMTTLRDSQPPSLPVRFKGQLRRRSYGAPYEAGEARLWPLNEKQPQTSEWHARCVRLTSYGFNDGMLGKPSNHHLGLGLARGTLLVATTFVAERVAPPTTRSRFRGAPAICAHALTPKPCLWESKLAGPRVVQWATVTMRREKALLLPPKGSAASSSWKLADGQAELSSFDQSET